MVTALRWLGGKSERGNGCGRWIANQLPATRGYCEPFGGMLGVLLQRPQRTKEMVNDLNGRIVNWWRIVRDRHEELGEWLEWTAQESRAEYDWARDNLDSDDPVQRAAAFTLAVQMSLSAQDYAPPGKYSWRFGSGKHWNRDTLRPIAERLKKVALENMDACEFVSRISKLKWAKDITIYCDPPYTTANAGRDYTVHRFDPDRLTDVLLAHPGPVAISGYNDEWDRTGWYRQTKTVATGMNVRPGSKARREEVLWTNYRPEETDGIF